MFKKLFFAYQFKAIRRLGLVSLLFANNYYAQNFCEPTWQYNSDGNMITNVQFGTINNTSPFTSGSTPSYENFLNLTTDIELGQTYRLSVKAPSSTFPSDIAVLFDLNQDGQFDATSELYYVGRVGAQNPANAETVFLDVDLPATTLTGATRMRVIKATNLAAYSNASAPSIIVDPCGSYRSGQIEDYTINVINSGSTNTCSPTITNAIEPISRVEMSGLVNSSSANISGAVAVEDFTVQVADVHKNSAYNLKIQGNTNGAPTNHLRVFIDWNQDGQFDVQSEYYHTVLNQSTGVDGIESVISIQIPATAIEGNVEMKIFKDRNTITDLSLVDPCASIDNGQIETYTLNVLNALQVNNVAIQVQNGALPQITSLNQSLQLEATVNPSNVDQRVTWSITSGQNFINLSSTGLVQGLTTGNAIVRATSVFDVTKFAELTIEVLLSIHVDSVVVKTVGNQSTTITTLYQPLQLEASVYPLNLDQTVEWQILSGSEFADLTANGVIFPRQNGVVVVQAKSSLDTTVFGTIQIIINNGSLSVSNLDVSKIKVFPNPTSNFIIVDSEILNDEIVVIDASGKIVLTENLISKNQRINVSNLEVGIYYLNYNNSTRIFIKE